MDVSLSRCPTRAQTLKVTVSGIASYQAINLTVDIEQTTFDNAHRFLVFVLDYTVAEFAIAVLRQC
jgi:hypothetical protein